MNERPDCFDLLTVRVICNFYQFRTNLKSKSAGEVRSCVHWKIKEVHTIENGKRTSKG